jgi:hypothetical protein
MTVRDAKFGDTMQMAALLRRGYDRSRYAEIEGLEVDMPEAKRIITNAIQRQNGTNCGATFAQVSERAGKVEGLFIGVLDRVYHIGTKLCAHDLFFLMDEGGSPRDAERMLRNYVAWAESNPAVVLIQDGTTDAVGDWKRAGKMLVRQGFRQIGGIYERAVTVRKQEEIAA